MKANIENELVNIKNDYIAKMKELKFQAQKKKTLILFGIQIQLSTNLR